MRSLCTRFSAAIMVLVCLGANGFGADGMRPVHLRCEYQVNPLGIDTDQPLLSWQLESDQRGQSQSAYHVLVAGSRDMLDQNIGDLWDSGKVAGDQSLNVRYRGKPLKSRAQYFWKVRVWNQDGQASDWSGAACWAMGILDQNQWKGQWIKSNLQLYPYQRELKKLPDHDRELTRKMWIRARSIRNMTADVTEAPAVWLRKEFVVRKKLRRATAYIAGLGFYELYLNGKKATDHYFNTTVYDYGKTVPYLVHDLTDELSRGNNAIGVILANGYYNPVIPCALREYANDFINTPRLRCELRLEYTDGTIDEVVSDQSWHYTTDGPIRFNSLRAGETYDARKQLGRWSTYGYHEKGWHPAFIASAPPGRMKHQAIPPLRIIKEIPAVSVQPHDGGWRFDIGVQCTGWARVRIRGKAGQKITIRYPGVGLHTLGRYQTDEYLCSGRGDEYYAPRFSFKGYRYIDVAGLEYEPKPEDLVGLQVVSDLKTSGTFSCSHEKINQLQEAHLRTVRNYNIQLPMDPVREKSCWTQDMQSNFECTAYNFNLHTMYRKWQFDYLDQIFADGYVPCVVPSAFDGPNINGPWWGGMLIYNPWQLYHFYGDVDILAKSYPAMKRYLAYLDGIAKDHIVSWGLGDWLDVAAQNRSNANPLATTVPYTSTCAYFHFTDILRQTAQLLGQTDDAARYTDQMEVIRQALHKKFFNAETGVYDKGSQTAYLLALRLKIVPAKQRNRVLDNLKKQIARDDFHLSSGFVGMPFLLTQLTEDGLGDLAWKIATRKTYPGWFDMIFNRHNSVFMEAWAADWKQGRFVQMPSLAGPIGAWFYRSLAGIRPDRPGFKSFIIHPYTDTLEWVKCGYESPYGLIRSDWRKRGHVLTMQVVVPVNSTATVYIPGRNITEGGVPATQARGVTRLRREKGCSVFKVASGRYQFTTQR